MDAAAELKAISVVILYDRSSENGLINVIILFTMKRLERAVN